MKRPCLPLPAVQAATTKILSTKWLNTALPWIFCPPKITRYTVLYTYTIQLSHYHTIFIHWGTKWINDIHTDCVTCTHDHIPWIIKLLYQYKRTPTHLCCAQQYIHMNLIIASFTRPQKGGLLLTACTSAKLLDDFPVKFPIKLKFYQKNTLNIIYMQIQSLL